MIACSVRPVFVRPGSVREIGGLLGQFGITRLFMVTGKSSFVASGAASRIAREVGGIHTEHFDEVDERPTLAAALRGVDRVHNFDPQVILAVGGGCVIDTAKLIAGLAAQPDPATAWHSPWTAVPLPVWAVPTTAGSGAEATHFAVLYVDNAKHSVAHVGIRPAVAIVDAELTASVSPRQAALSGADALTQAIESYWSTRATDASRTDSAAALRLLDAHLENAVLAPTAESRAAVAEAAHVAGRAIDVARTTACHALSYVITTRWGVPHGQAVALTLPAMYRLNAKSCVSTRMRQAFSEMNTILGHPDATGAAARLEALLKRIGLATTLSALDIRGDCAATIAKNVNADRLTNNPHPMTHEEVVKLLRSIK